MSDTYAVIALLVSITLSGAALVYAGIGWRRNRTVVALIRQLHTHDEQVFLDLAGYLSDNPRQVARCFARVNSVAMRRAFIADYELELLEAIGAEPSVVTRQVHLAAQLESDRDDLLRGYGAFRYFVGRMPEAALLAKAGAVH